MLSSAHAADGSTRRVDVFDLSHNTTTFSPITLKIHQDDTHLRRRESSGFSHQTQLSPTQPLCHCVVNSCCRVVEYGIHAAETAAGASQGVDGSRFK